MKTIYFLLFFFTLEVWTLTERHGNKDSIEPSPRTNYISELTKGKMAIGPKLIKKPGTWWQSDQFDLQTRMKTESFRYLIQTGDFLGNNEHCTDEMLEVNDHSLYWKGPIIISDILNCYIESNCTIETRNDMKLNYEVEGLNTKSSISLKKLLEVERLTKQLTAPYGIQSQNVTIRNGTKAAFAWFNPLYWETKGNYSPCYKASFDKDDYKFTARFPLSDDDRNVFGLYGIYYICEEKKEEKIVLLNPFDRKRVKVIRNLLCESPNVQPSIKPKIKKLKSVIDRLDSVVRKRQRSQANKSK